MIIRDMHAEDLPAVMGIWNHYIKTTSYNWRHEGFTPQELASWFSQHGTPDHPAKVAEEQGQIVGFGALSTFRSSPGYNHTAEDTIYLHKDACQKGIGTELMQAMFEHAKAGGLQQVVAMIDSGNESSIRFHEKLGFETVGILKDVGYKFGKTLSCVVMQKRL